MNPAAAGVLARVPAGAPARVDLVVDYLDHTAYDHLEAWTSRHRAGGATGPARRGRDELRAP